MIRTNDKNKVCYGLGCFGVVSRLSDDSDHRFRVELYFSSQDRIYRTGNVLCDEYTVDMEHNLLCVACDKVSESFTVDRLCEPDGVYMGVE